MHPHAEFLIPRGKISFRARAVAIDLRLLITRKCIREEVSVFLTHVGVVEATDLGPVPAATSGAKLVQIIHRQIV